MPFSDVLIGWTFAVGNALSPIVRPIESGGESIVSGLASVGLTAPLQLVNSAKEWMAANGSKHSDRLPLMNPFHVILIISLYLVIVISGKRIGANSSVPKLEVKQFALIHNLLMVALSAYMCLSILANAFFSKSSTGYRYGLWANPPDETESGWSMAKVIWVFYFSKILEFNDTFIMIAKKNFRQVSFLHVYHHGSIFAVWWLVTFTAPTGEAYFSAALNSFIHVVMYGYYFCSAIGIKQVSFIKKYITMMQMTQFCLMMCQATYDIVHSFVIVPSLPAPQPPFTSNSYPVYLSSILFFYMISMLALFYNFYQADRRREREARKAGNANGAPKVGQNGKGKEE
ncbi:hypothetical protein M427DRAFT_138369 [Gonapodya prolifera JEL478]|uniref:Elongation of fatty acids protein n=1 Tax=Gonapodya prolifera (strain JEL478) TaxID=1344416 RepID=A0A139A3D2_GONPJ|nr:hypothetical protein M427DRAFT_138369 [Gonapodya prolifera JEL478]|eukprot:KXS11281.1 hypothetical protein M427DRAFT_138369 [Gonapodya prolifera JEL478]